MSKREMLSLLVKQRLTAAAEEIFGLFERSIAEYEEELSRSKEENERQQKLLDAVFSPQLQIHRADVQQLLGVKGEVPPEQQECSSSVDQEDPEPPHIKEEQEELWSRQEKQQLEGLEEADIKFTLTSVPVKTEDDEDKAQSSQLHQRQTEQMETEADGEDCGGPEPARNSHPDSPLQPVSEDETSYSEPETDDSRDWEETREPQSGLNSPKTSKAPVSDEEFYTVNTPVSSSECAGNFIPGGHLQDYTGIQTGEKQFTCSVCGKTFGRKAHLNEHLTIHSGRKPFPCSVCGKKLSRKYNLIAHMKLHSEEKRLSCSVCKVKIQCQSKLVKHMSTHTGEKSFRCSVCGEVFSHRRNLRRHSTVHTGEKPFSCSICGTRFSQNSDLSRHLTIHTGEKPFSCSVCGKRFSQKVTMKRHLNVHTGEKPFSCSGCDKKFTRPCYVKKHKCVGESSSNK